MADAREATLLRAAGLFLVVFAAALMLSPAAREGTWNVPLRTSQWIGVLVWAAVFFIGHRLVSRYLPDRDPYLLSIPALLSGWGILTLFRLDPALGIRQALWLAVSMFSLIVIVRRADSLDLLRRYKYVLLGAGLLLTALTLILGTNPTGAGPRLWLGCCGVYLQPSEPLKLLLVAYLAAYLADQAGIRLGVFPMLIPTTLVTGLALVLLLVQRDLGTASIFILLPTVMLYLATDKRRVLLATGAGLLVAALVGFFFIDVVHARLGAWFNPWTDASGRSYQIVQSLLAVANGGVFGRGPGLGSPTLVPVAQSDFIFSAIAEETGLVGAVALLAAYALWLLRGMRAALRASSRYERLLAAGLVAYLGMQALLIIGGDLRMLPLTGVTLPFVAYGGTSLLTSFIATALLLKISAAPAANQVIPEHPRPYLVVGALLSLGLIGAVAIQSWWSVVRGPDLLSRTDNPRRSIADRYVKRGSLLDRNNEPIDMTIGDSGGYQRTYLYPDLAPISGYTQAVYGQAGLEASLDDYLRGLQGNPVSLIWWDQLLYGMPPPGLDVRLSLDLGLQKRTDAALGSLKGAVVLLSASSGEILAIASHPTFDPNQLGEIGGNLATRMDAPLLNRAALGAYRVGAAAAPFLNAAGVQQADEARVADLYRRLGFLEAPDLRLAVAAPTNTSDPQLLRISPLQMALAAAALTNQGIVPPPRIALAVDTPQQGWLVLPALQTPKPALDPAGANNTALRLAVQQETYWQYLATAQEADSYVTWYVGGTLPNWQGTPLAIAVLIEGNDPRAASVGQQILQAAIGP